MIGTSQICAHYLCPWNGFFPCVLLLGKQPYHLTRYQGWNLELILDSFYYATSFITRCGHCCHQINFTPFSFSAGLGPMPLGWHQFSPGPMQKSPTRVSASTQEPFSPSSTLFLMLFQKRKPNYLPFHSLKSFSISGKRGIYEIGWICESRHLSGNSGSATHLGQVTLPSEPPFPYP